MKIPQNCFSFVLLAEQTARTYCRAHAPSAAAMSDTKPAPMVVEQFEDAPPGTNDVSAAQEAFGSIDPIEIAALHNTRLKIILVVFIAIHVAIIVWLLYAIVNYKNTRLLLMTGAMLISLLPLGMQFFAVFSPEEVGKLIGGAWIAKSKNASGLRYMVLVNILFVGLICGSVHFFMYFYSAGEYLGVDYSWIPFAKTGCTYKICGLNRFCAQNLGKNPMTFYPNPYVLDRTTLLDNTDPAYTPPRKIDPDGLIVGDDTDGNDGRAGGACECKEPDGYGGFHNLTAPTGGTNCVSEREFDPLKWQDTRRTLAELPNEAQWNANPGFRCAFLCPQLGEKDESGNYDGELVYWTPTLAWIYLLLPVILLGLFALELLVTRLFGVAVYPFEYSEKQKNIKNASVGAPMDAEFRPLLDARWADNCVYVRTNAEHAHDVARYMQQADKAHAL